MMNIRPRLRTLLLCLLLLVAGAAVNVAVAWGIAMLVRYDRVGTVYSYTQSWDGQESKALLIVAKSFGSECVDAHSFGKYFADRFGIGYGPLAKSDLGWAVSRDTFNAGLIVFEEARGWPTLCLRLRCEHKFHPGRLDRVTKHAIEVDKTKIDVQLHAARVGGNRFPWALLGPRKALPYDPIWPGFAINTIFYAGILWVCWLLFSMPFLAVRRRRRVKRGLCPACAYPVGSSNLCTECGAVLPLPPGEGRGEGV